LDGLRELGYVDGHNVVVEWRSTGGGEARLRELATELVGLPVDVLVTTAGTTEFAREVTATVPIVFVGGDPVASGLVTSLARPGGNITGFTVGAIVIRKQDELLKEAAPRISRVAMLYDANLATPPAPSGSTSATEALGLQVQRLGVRSAEELPSAFEMAARDGVDGLRVLETPLLRSNQGLITELALKHGWPSISQFHDYAAAGGLLAYGPNPSAVFRRAATYVDKILKGARPADLPIEQPREFDFVINLKTAQALGLTIPERVLLQATEVIQ
jgi:putative ABC transport system substrate-binding protein